MRVLDTEERAIYNIVTNSGVICPKCKKPIGTVEYIKIFKVKNYLPPAGFADHELVATMETCLIE